MQTVQLQCGNCRQLMAISVEHLGGQVQCPHCKTVVQTPPPRTVAPAPPPPPPPAPEPEPVIEVVDLEPPESIFSPPESQDAVGETESPKVEMPEEEEPPVEIVEDPKPRNKPSAEEERDAELPKFKPRPVYTATVLPIIALIFLIPYAVVMTAFVIYLLFYGTPRATHPFDMLPDPVPDKGKGGPRQVSRVIPTTKLDKHQFVSVGKTIQIGDIAVTPQRVLWTDEGDLKLVLRAKNISTNTAFDPINEVFVRYAAAKPGTEPYTFLETRSHNIFGAYLAYYKDGNDEEQAEALLRPQQETTFALKTYEDHREKLAKVAKSNDTVVWRVHVRRGFVKWKGKDVSTTAVIGVEFNMQQIERAKKDT